MMVSVIVLTWNRAQLLSEAVESILNQTYPEFELLIIDNESTDHTEEYVSSLTEGRIRYFRHANRGNLSVNRNYGISQAKGDFIAFCDDDDLWEPAKLETQLRIFEQHPEAAMVCSDGLFFSKKGVLGYLIKRKESGWITLDDLLSGRNDVVMSSAMIRREVFKDVGKWEEDPEIFTVEDYNLWVRIAARHPIYYLNEPLVRIRVHEAMSSHKDTRIMMAKVKTMFTKLNQKGILSEEQYQWAQRNVRQRYRMAVFKEFIKKLPGAKKVVDFGRRSAYAGRIKKENL